MPRIGILTCSNATQELDCSSVSCLASLRRREGAFETYPQEDSVDLIGIINCPGCPTLTGPDKLLQRIRALTEFKLDAIHFSYCITSLCPFREKFRKALEESYPEIKIIMGTHHVKIPPEEYREKVRKLFSQEKKTMTDIILKRM